MFNNHYSAIAANPAGENNLAIGYGHNRNRTGCISVFDIHADMITLKAFGLNW